MTKGNVYLEMVEKIQNCNNCRLGEGRNLAVPGEGNLSSEVIFVGEGPGQEEDKTGRPFVGRSGELLNNVLAYCGWYRNDIYIANCVKCRPPGNRAPFDDEVSECSKWLDLQIKLIRPKILVLMGSSAIRRFVPDSGPVSCCRGTWVNLTSPISCRAILTFHPAYILRKQDYKSLFVQDTMKAKQSLSPTDHSFFEFN